LRERLYLFTGKGEDYHKVINIPKRKDEGDSFGKVWGKRVVSGESRPFLGKGI